MKRVWWAVPLCVMGMTVAGCEVGGEPEPEPVPAGYYYYPGGYYPSAGYYSAYPEPYTEYYVVGGRYYHWHPDNHRWVEVRGVPRGGRTYHVERLPARPVHVESGYRGVGGGGRAAGGPAAAAARGAGGPAAHGAVGAGAHGDGGHGPAAGGAAHGGGGGHGDGGHGGGGGDGGRL